MADYKAFHDEMLAELDPVGTMETAMAERIVSLWWRLRRAECMQNEVIEDMIGLFVTNNTSRSHREYHLSDQGLRPGDPGFDLDGLPLDRIACNDWSCTRILDRMLLYERRIESSVIKLTKELKKQQLMRRAERRDISQDQAIAQTEALMEKKVNLKKQACPEWSRRGQYAGLRSEIRNTNIEIRNKLKKQSQFVPDLNGAKSFVKGDYDKNPLCGVQQNKANIMVNSS